MGFNRFSAAAACALLLGGAGPAMAQKNGCMFHPVLNPAVPEAVDPVEWHPQQVPLQGLSQVTQNEDLTRTTIVSPNSFFDDAVDPFSSANPSNLLPTVYENLRDCAGNEVVNTLPSTPENPYNLHPDPVVSSVDPTSPTDDLHAIFAHLDAVVRSKDYVDEYRRLHQRDGDASDRDAGKGKNKNKNKNKNRDEDDRNGNSRGDDPPRVRLDMSRVQMAIDILEGNPIPDRTYSGFPLLHYNGPNKVQTVDPDTRTVTVHQIWYDNHIESNAGSVDPSAVMDVPWTMRYVVDVLNKGHEDFAPMAMFFDNPDERNGARLPLAAMDQTFFPMEEGRRYVFEIAMPPGKHWNLTYHWGWRVHPPRVQVAENALKAPMGITIPDWERNVFGEDPSASESAKLAAIDMIGDVAPAKRMWRALRAMRDAGPGIPRPRLAALTAAAKRAFSQWQDRTRLPDGVRDGEDSDVTLLFVNNTIYGHVKGMSRDAQVMLDTWRTRGTTVNIKLLNGDYFPHGYFAVDFGGMRGWENTFHNTVPVGGQGPWFTFGRHHFWILTPFPVMVPAAERPAQRPGRRIGMPGDDDLHAARGHRNGFKPRGKGRPFTPFGLEHDRSRRSRDHVVDGIGEHDIELTLNFEPSQRLRLYQFDPLHHDVAVWSMH